LPNLEGSAPMHQGQGSGLTDRPLGEASGTPFVTLIDSEMPMHNHLVQGNFNLGDLFTPSPSTALTNSDPGSAYVNSNSNFVQMPSQATTPAGGSLPHQNMQPFLTVMFIIAQQGVFPPRS